MKPLLVLGLLLSGSAGIAQERVPDEEAKKIAAALVKAADKAKAPLKVEADADTPFAKRKDKRGALVMAVKGLEAKTIADARAEIVPVGQLWLKELSPVIDNRPASAKKLLILPVTHNDDEVNLVLCSLGVQTVKDRLSLVVLGKEKTPLLTLPLEKIDQKQDKPIEFNVTIEDDQATLSVTLLGKYRAPVRVGLLED